MSAMKRVFTAIQVECDRQQVGVDRVMMLADAYMDALDILGCPSEEDFLERGGLAYRIEPKNRGVYRRTPVFFDDLSMGLAPGLIERAMMQWWDRVWTMWWATNGKGMAAWDVDHLIREFLVIHPFQDGNGRIAWLLRVWLLDQWDDPEPLPNYFPQNAGKHTV